MKSSLLIAGLFNLVSAIDETKNPALVAALHDAATALDRQKLLNSDKDWIFDFNAQPDYTYEPGSVVNANAATFPALATFDMTLAMLNLGPCAMLPPHYHPRATNLVVAIEGKTNTYMIEENGARLVRATLTPGKMTIFPKGSLHTMQNTGCTNATLVSTLNSADAGTQNMANSLFSLPADLVKAGFGDASAAWLKNFEEIAKNIPAVGTGSILGSAECLAACKNGGTYTGQTVIA